MGSQAFRPPVGNTNAMFRPRPMGGPMMRPPIGGFIRPPVIQNN